MGVHHDTEPIEPQSFRRFPDEFFQLDTAPAYLANFQGKETTRAEHTLLFDEDFPDHGSPDLKIGMVCEGDRCRIDTREPEPKPVAVSIVNRIREGRRGHGQINRCVRHLP